MNRKEKWSILGFLKRLFKGRTCIVTEIDYEYNAWECSACKDIWQLSDGSPEKNNMHYCTNCGARIVKYIGAE